MLSRKEEGSSEGFGVQSWPPCLAYKDQAFGLHKDVLQ